MSSNMDEMGHDNPNQSGGPSPGYETSDVNTRGLLISLVGLFVAISVTMAITWGIFRYYAVTEVEPAPPSPFADVRQLPTGPELQVIPREELLDMRAKQQQQLNSYSWVDRKAGIVQIPVDRAMDLLLQKGLPVLPAAQQTPSEPAPKPIARQKTKSEIIVAGTKGSNRNE